MLLSLLIAAAQPAAAAAPDPVIIALVAGEGEKQCLPDHSLCLDLPRTEESGGALHLSAPATGSARDAAFALPYAADDGQALGLWPYLVSLPRHADDASGAQQYLMGVIVGVRTMYSGGGGSGSRLHLLRLDTTPSSTRLGDEVLDVVWGSSLMIRACFSEADMKNRREACHDEYGFTGKLSAAPADGAELPALTYRSTATAYPRGARRWGDNSDLRLTAADLVRETDPICSYERTLHYNPATSRYEMDRPAPECSDYTTP